MFLRSKIRRKDGKDHRAWSVVENRRVHDGRVVQRQVLYLGEINDSQRAAWSKAIEVFDEGAGQSKQIALFPADRLAPALDCDVVSIRPIYHQHDTRIEAHIFIAFLAYCQLVTLKPAEGAGAGIDAESRARKTRHHADDRCRTAHHGRSAGRLVPLYRAGEGSAAPASTVEAPTSRSAATENHRPKHPRNRMSSYPA